jgi:hypothetical protein
MQASARTDRNRWFAATAAAAAIALVAVLAPAFASAQEADAEITFSKTANAATRTPGIHGTVGFGITIGQDQVTDPSEVWELPEPIVVVDEVPAPLTNVSAFPNNSNLATCDVDGNTVTCTVTALRVTDLRISISATIPDDACDTTDRLVNTASASGLITAQDSATTLLICGDQPFPELALDLTADPSQVEVGGTFDWIVTLSNVGGVPRGAQDHAIVLELPEGLEQVGAPTIADPDTLDLYACDEWGPEGAVACGFGLIAPGSPLVVTVPVQVTSEACPTTIEASAQALTANDSPFEIEATASGSVAIACETVDENGNGDDDGNGDDGDGNGDGNGDDTQVDDQDDDTDGEDEVTPVEREATAATPISAQPTYTG